MKSCVGILVLLVFLDCGICRYSAIPSSRHNAAQKYPKTIEYYTSPNTWKITIPIMIHLDKALTRGLSRKYKQTAKNYFKQVLDNVTALYAHPSLNETVEFELLDVKMLKNLARKFQTDGNVSKYLKSYCHWQQEKKMMKKKWYYSMLFTGLDLFYLDGSNRAVNSSTGRSFIRGICNIKYSCSVLEWSRHNTAYSIAHELAHSLGISHDGLPNNQCHGQRFIMDASYNPSSPATTWSSCSKQALNKFLLSKKSWCLYSSKNDQYNVDAHPTVD